MYQKSLPRLTDSNRTEINVAYKSMKKENMWKLSNGKYLEEELYKLGLRLDFEQ